MHSLGSCHIVRDPRLCVAIARDHGQSEPIMTLTPSPQMLKKFAGGGRGLAQVELSQDP